MTTQKEASIYANGMMGRGLVPDIGAARVDAHRTLAGLNQWFRNPIDATALLVLGDSTGFPPGTTNGSAIGGVGGYARWPDYLASMIAASSFDITVRTQLWDANNGNNYYEAPRVLKTATGGLRYAALPGTSNSTLTLAKSNRNLLTGTRHFFAAKVQPAAWAPVNSLTTLSDWGTASGTWSWSFGVQASTGKLWFAYTQDGATNVNRFSTVAPSGTVDGVTIMWLGADVQWNNGSSGNTITFYTSADGRTWTMLGTAVTTAGVLTPFVTTQPYQVGCRTIGGGATQNFTGNVYEIQIRKGGMYGPTILPAMPDQWNWQAAFFPMNGGPQLDIINAAWPGQGLTQFDDPTNLPLMVPHYPYLGTIVNTGHNDSAFNTASALADKWDRLLDRISRRAPDAEFAVLSQNPTLRTDGAGSGFKPDATARMGRLAAYAKSRGMGVIDTFQSFEDYVLGGQGSGLSDLLDPAGLPTQEIHPMGPGVVRQAQKVWDEVIAA